MKLSYFSLLLLLLVGTFTSCDDDDDVINVVTGEKPVDITGLTYADDDDHTFDFVYDGIVSDLEAADAIDVVAEIDHANTATSTGFNLRPTRVVMFGNPALGTPLMKQNMLAGLDLPQKIIVYQTSEDDIIAAYNSTVYLSSRYDLDDNGELTTIGNALRNFVESNTDEEVSDALDLDVDEEEGIETSTSNDSVEDVYDRLRDAIEDNDDLSIIAEVDHSANADDLDIVLPPSRLIIFGNPDVDTPFLQEEQTVAIDLPVRILVFSDNGTTTVAWNDPEYLADRHDIPDDLDQITMMRTLLDNLTAAALND